MKNKLFLGIIILFLFFSLNAFTQTIDLNEGLIVYYPFNGNVEDESGNENHGEKHGVNITDDVSGEKKGGLRFDGNDYVKIPLDINPATMPKMTFTAWVLPRARKNMTIFSNEDGGGDRALICVNGSGWAAFRGGGKLTTTVTPEPSEQKWVFVAVSYDQDNKRVKVYVNEKKISEWASIVQGRDYTYLGQHPYAGKNSFKGNMDEVRIYNRVLSDSEIEKLRTEQEVFVPKKKEYYYVVTSNTLNVRSKPSASGASLGTVAKGDTILPTEVVAPKSVSEYRWIKFDYNGKQGYVYAKYLKQYEKDVKELSGLEKFSDKYMRWNRWQFWVFMLVCGAIVIFSVIGFPVIDAWLIQMSGKLDSAPGAPWHILICSFLGAPYALFFVFWQDRVQYYLFENFLFWPAGQGFVIWVVWMLTIALFVTLLIAFIESFVQVGFIFGWLRFVIIAALSLIGLVTVFIITAVLILIAILLFVLIFFLGAMAAPRRRVIIEEW